jgi:phage FluMu protein Com
MPDLAPHPYNPVACDHMARHDHEYKPGAGLPQRCTCGSRRWLITAGGPLDLKVTCRKCKSLNRLSTKYEMGRYDALIA